MTARHSTYKKESRWNKADAISKTQSSYQRNANCLKGVIRKLTYQLKVERARRIMLSTAIAKATELGYLTKSQLKPFLKRKKEIEKEILKQIEEQSPKEAQA